MTGIADLLERDVSAPVGDFVEVGNDDPDTVFSELTEYIATDGIKAGYERLFCAMAAAMKSPTEGVGVWISGLSGSGKSSFAKHLGYVLANREVRGIPASSLFLKRMESKRVAECVEYLNRASPYEIFMFDLQAELRAKTLVPQTGPEQIADVMYRVLRRELDYAEDDDISELDIELERENKLAEFRDLCRAEYREEWRKIRRRLSVNELVGRLFDLCETRRPGKSIAFIADEAGDYAALDAGRLENLSAVVEQFGKQSMARLKAGKIPGPAWLVVTGRETLPACYHRVAARHINLPDLQNRFKHQIALSAANIGEAAAGRVLRKKESQEAILRNLFRDCGASLMRNVKLERCSRSTECDEDEFVRFYPYLPHLIGLSIDIAAGIRLHPSAPRTVGGHRSIVKQTLEMLVSDRTRLADQPVGTLVSVDKIYDLVEGSMPPKKRQDILEIRERLDGDKDYPGMAARVAKAICLMEFAKADLPRTTHNIAALLVQRVTEVPPHLAVAAILYRMKELLFIRESEDGWKLYDLDELRRAPDAVAGLKNAVGTVNPRPPGWRSGLIQLMKKLVLRALAWYTLPSQELNARVSRSLDEIVWAIDHLSLDVADRFSANTVALDRLSMDIVALAGRLAQWESASGDNSRFHYDTGPRSGKTAYVIGLFGTGRRYINELIVRNIGERAKYFRDTIRLHPGPTPMIYSGHATMRHVCRNQELPAVMGGILEAVGSGFANLIFVYRNPFDSLLTNWIWWRTFIRDYKSISGIAEVYKNIDDLCADLERNFLEFKAFADGDPEFFAGAPGLPFLSFPEFVEETELHLQSATLALRLEDFTIDPSKEFSKIVEVMSADPDLSSVCVAPPITKPYGYLTVQDRVPRFKAFIGELDAETRKRIVGIGYDLTV
jgi:hypothetical protein